jgi:hypothetical protein
VVRSNRPFPHPNPLSLTVVPRQPTTSRLILCSLRFRYRRVVGIDGDILEAIIGITVADRRAVNVDGDSAVEPYPTRRAA